MVPLWSTVGGPASHGGFTIASMVVQLSFDFNVTARDSELKPHWGTKTVESRSGRRKRYLGTPLSIGEFTACSRQALTLIQWRCLSSTTLFRSLSGDEHLSDPLIEFLEFVCRAIVEKRRPA
jgi:hypothetical protein